MQVREDRVIAPPTPAPACLPSVCTMVHQFPGDSAFVRRLIADLDYMSGTAAGRLHFSKNFTGRPVAA